MITQNMKDVGIHCKGRGFNCYNCKDKSECVDYIECEEIKVPVMDKNRIKTLIKAYFNDGVPVIDIVFNNDYLLKINHIATLEFNENSFKVRGQGHTIEIEYKYIKEIAI